ncbi:MAG: ABC transporter substrate-binding protein [Chloroflexota bacterium]
MAQRELSRRSFLMLLAGGAAAVAAGCQQPAAAPAATATKAAAAATPAATAAATKAATAAAATQAPVQSGAAKPFAGTELNVACFTLLPNDYLKTYLPEFEQQTGIKANMDIQAFAVYNQRADLELSTKGSAWDVMNITFIYSMRWLGSGWFTNLEDYLKDRNKTPADWDPADFSSGAQASMKNDKGETHGFAYFAGTYCAAWSRADIVEKAGLKLPTTFAEMGQTIAAVHNKENVTGFVNDKLHHWNYIPYLMGYGGGVFKDPPNNLTPTLDTPEAIEAAEFYSNLLRSYSPDGTLSYTDDQAMTAQLQGRANMRSAALDWFIPLGDPAKSKVATTVKITELPVGPKGSYPASNSHGFGIPIGSKKKDAAWEFIKWAMSKEMQLRLVREKGYGTPTRLSAVRSPEFKKAMMVNGVDAAAVYEKVLDLGGKGGYMKYRIVPVFPQVGDKINKAIEIIVTKQKSAADAMKEAQQEALAEVKKAGYKVDA